ncbi:MAG TPA: phosphotransferase, partial [Micromonosporaceae bacterium]
MSRTVTLLLLDHTGAALGALPPFEVELPYWPEAWDVVEGARRHFGIDLTVLRLVSGEHSVPPGGAVTYLAQTSDPVDGLVAAATVDLSDHPLRADYARPGGPRRGVDWAVRTLAGLGVPVLGAAQRKTWNLSSIWRLDTGRGPVWLKEVPGFFSHEASVLRWLDAAGLGRLAVPLVAAEGLRMLLDHVPGTDLFGAELGTRLDILADMHQIQRATASQVDQLLAVGVPDLRAASLHAEIDRVVAGYGDGDPRLAYLVAGLAERLAAVAACGVPETLVHGDLHPGNVRGDHSVRRI